LNFDWELKVITGQYQNRQNYVKIETFCWKQSVKFRFLVQNFAACGK